MKKFKILSLAIMLLVGVMCFSACQYGFTETYFAMSNSMAPTIETGDQVKVKKSSNYEVGDIIVYEVNGYICINRIIYIHRETKEYGIGYDTYYICHGDNVQNVDGSVANGDWEDDRDAVEILLDYDITIELLDYEYAGILNIVQKDDIEGVVTKIIKD